MAVIRILLVLAVLACPLWPQVLPVSQVQGSGPRSPYENQWVTVQGVVTGVTASGFFLQDPEPDADPRTSEGLYVYTGGAPSDPVRTGNLLRVRGRVQEYVPSADPYGPPLTELVQPEVTLLSVQHPLPEPVVLSASLPHPGGALDQLEPYEGMRVRVPSLTVTGPTSGRSDEVTASAVSTGVFFGVPTGLPRPFREPGFPPFDPVPSGNPPRFDGNPEVLRVDSTCLVGTPPLDLAAGAVVQNLVGPLTFSWRRYTLCPEPGFQVSFQPPPPPPPGRGRQELRVASWNVQRFYDDVDDPGWSEPVLAPQGFALRLEKLAGAVAGFLGFPHVLLLQEVESERVLAELARRVDEVAATAGEDLHYRTILGFPDPGGLRLAALVREKLGSGEIVLEEAASILRDEELENPDGSREPLFDRPPLVLRLAVKVPGHPLRRLAIVGVHLRSMNGLLSTQPGSRGWPTEGARVRAKRAQQAEALARWVDAFQRQNPAVPLLVLGDFNAFEFSDGVVDVVGTVAGSPPPPEAVVLPTRDLVAPDLVVLTALEPPSERYSYVYDGSAQALDHVLVSPSLLAAGWRWELRRPRLAADFPETARNQPSPFRVSDHDPLLLVLELPRIPRRVLLPAGPPRP